MKKLVLNLTFMPSKPFSLPFLFRRIGSLFSSAFALDIGLPREGRFLLFVDLSFCLAVFLTSAYPVGYRFFFANSKVPFMSVKSKESWENLFGIPFLSLKREGCRNDFSNDNNVSVVLGTDAKGN